MDRRIGSILLAEDDHQLRRLLAQLLRFEGYDVIEVGSGDELLAHVDAFTTEPALPPPNVILCDVRMPGCTGLEVLEYLRATGNCTPVIMMTAFGDQYTHREALRLGADRSFDKPFETDDMIAAIHALA